jgi:hypothetical protein
MAKPKFKIKHTITKKEWNKTHKDFKSIIDGVHYVMKLTDKGTALVPVNIKESVVTEAKDMTFTDYLKVLDAKFEDAIAAVKGENGSDTEITPTRGDILQNFTLFRNYVSSLTKKYKGDKTKLRFLTEKVREYESVINESVNEAKTITVKFSDDDQTLYFSDGQKSKVDYDGEFKYKGKWFDTSKMKSSKDLGKMLSKAFPGTKFIQTESVNEGKDPEIITQLRDVVKNGYKTLKDPKSGKRMKVDTYSASAIVGVYDKLSSSNKEKFVKQGLLGMQSLAFKFIK